MVKSFENYDNILHGWAKGKVQKGIAKALNRLEKPEEKRQSRSFRKWQSSETKPCTNLILVSREPLLYLEFNKPNKQCF